MTPQRRMNTHKLSPAQDGILFQASMTNRSDVDTEQILCSIQEPLDVETLQQAWRKIVDRHDALRTEFHVHGDETFQRIQRDVALPWTVKDLRILPAAQQETEMKRWLSQDRDSGFDLERAPLLRLNLFRVADDKWFLVWTFHRGILDHRSLSVVLTEVFRTYDAALRGE